MRLVLGEGMDGTYHAGLQLWWLAIKHVRWLDAILNHPYGSVEETHQVTLSTVSRPSKHAEGDAQHT